MMFLKNNLFHFLISIILFSGCVPQPIYHSVSGSSAVASVQSVVKVGDSITGVASYYADKFHGRKTANGEIFNMHDLTAAHKTLPFNTVVKVTNLKNNKSVKVRINDRGPFVKNRVIDLSLAAAKELDMLGTGTAEVRIDILETEK